jgi:hypothetical protein
MVTVSIARTGIADVSTAAAAANAARASTVIFCITMFVS